MAITELSPYLAVTCEALYVPMVDGSDPDNAPEMMQLVCDIIFKPNTKEDGVILVAGTAKGILANTFTFFNVGDPAGTYPWPFDEQIVNLADTDLNPSGANYTVTIKPKGYVSATNTVVPLEGWANRVGVLVCSAGTNTTPLLQWMPLESASDGTAYLIGPEGPTVVSTDANNAATIGTDGKIFVASGSIADNSITNIKIATNAAISLDKTADSATRMALTAAERTKLTNISGTNTGDQDLSGYVPTSRKVAGKALTGDITLTASDVGAAPASGQAGVNALTAAASVTVPATHSMHTLTMTQNTTLAFSNPTAGHAFTLKLSGAFVPTFPASVTWAGGSAPTYASGKVYVFATFDAGTSWTGSAL